MSKLVDSVLNAVKNAAPNGSGASETWPNLSGPNDAAVLVKAGQLEVQTRPLPTSIPPKSVVIAIRSVGICGSDVHYWVHGSIGNFIVKSPMVIGHESAGEIIGVGEQVNSLNIGDHVAIEGGISCAHCSLCRHGRYNLCPSMEFFATPPYDGSLIRYIVHPADLCFKLPSNLSFDEGALCEPMSVAVMGCIRGGIKVGDRVAVLGAGPIGLMVLLVAKAYGASHVVITDISEERLKVAKQLGADDIFLIKPHTSPSSTAESIIHKYGAVDLAFDACGLSSTMTTAIHVTSNGGRVVAIGLAESQQTIPMSEVTVREVDIIGMFRYAHTYPICVNLLTAGKINVKPLITHHLNLIGSDGKMIQDRLIEGFDIAKTGRGGAIKVMFHL